MLEGWCKTTWPLGLRLWAKGDGGITRACPGSLSGEGGGCVCVVGGGWGVEAGDG